MKKFILISAALLLAAVSATAQLDRGTVIKKGAQVNINPK